MIWIRDREKMLQYKQWMENKERKALWMSKTF